MAKGRVAALLVAVGSLAGAVLWKRRDAGREHLDVYFADGSMVRYSESSSECERLLPVARRILARARG